MTHCRCRFLLSEDFWEIFLVWPFLYETYRFGLATLLFGVLVPIELVGRLVGEVRAKHRQPAPAPR